MMWLVTGVIIGVVGWWLVSWTRAHKIGVTWYEWLLAVLALGLGLLALQNYYAFLREMEPNAAVVMLALLGVPALILAGLAVFLVWWQGRTTKPTKA
ncbi:MAG: dehalogenase [Chloroflexi bacterium]|nr:dehalogenase [Chloroflexota bacterium]